MGETYGGYLASEAKFGHRCMWKCMDVSLEWCYRYRNLNDDIDQYGGICKRTMICEHTYRDTTTDTCQAFLGYWLIWLLSFWSGDSGIWRSLQIVRFHTRIFTLNRSDSVCWQRLLVTVEICLVSSLTKMKIVRTYDICIVYKVFVSKYL